MSRIAPGQSDTLQSEIAFIFHEIFDANAQQEAIAAYSCFHTVYGASLSTRKDVNMTKVLNRRLDVEAIEFFLRTRYPGNLLTCKLWACAYLYEAQEGVAPRGRIRARSGRITSPVLCLVILAWFGFRSAVKWLKGGLQVYWHHLL
jgi:hypothetical protein